MKCVSCLQWCWTKKSRFFPATEWWHHHCFGKTWHWPCSALTLTGDTSSFRWGSVLVLASLQLTNSCHLHSEAVKESSTMVFMRRRREPMVACSSMVGIKCQSKSNKQWSLRRSLKMAVWPGHCWEIAARCRHRCWAITKNRQQRYPTMPPERAVRHRHWQSQCNTQEHASDIKNCAEVPSLDIVKDIV